MSLLLQVDCYSGYKADERPLRFTPQSPQARTYEVKEVVDQWYGVGYTCFRIRADDNNLYILKHRGADDVWTLESFRRDDPADTQGHAAGNTGASHDNPSK